jgi:hypothetical protein
MHSCGQPEAIEETQACLAIQPGCLKPLLVATMQVQIFNLWQRHKRATALQKLWIQHKYHWWAIDKQDFFGSSFMEISMHGLEITASSCL